MPYCAPLGTVCEHPGSGKNGRTTALSVSTKWWAAGRIGPGMTSGSNRSIIAVPRTGEVAMRISPIPYRGSDRRLGMTGWLCAKSAIAGVGFLLVLVVEARAVQLVTPAEAAYPDDPSRPAPNRSPTAGPQIEVISPSLSGLVSSPFRFRIKFIAHGGATINPDSITITYKKIPAVDITQRIKSYIIKSGVEVDISDAELPAGTHPFLIDVKDSRERWAAPMFFKIGVEK